LGMIGNRKYHVERLCQKLLERLHALLVFLVLLGARCIAVAWLRDAARHQK